MAILQSKPGNFWEKNSFHNGNVKYLIIILFYHTAYTTVKKKDFKIDEEEFPININQIAMHINTELGDVIHPLSSCIVI